MPDIARHLLISMFLGFWLYYSRGFLVFLSGDGNDGFKAVFTLFWAGFWVTLQVKHSGFQKIRKEMGHISSVYCGTNLFIR